MSTLKADTIVASDGSSPVTLTKQSAAKAWVNFDGSASGATARDSFNNSSMTDNGTGNYDVNLSNAMSDTNQVTCVSNAQQAPISSFRNVHIQSILETASLINVNNYDTAQRDIPFNQMAVHGDLA
jgi:hypothetical protein